MVNIPGVAVAQGAEELKRQPFSFYVLEERSCAQAIVEGVVEVLSDEVPVGLGLDNALVSESVRDIGEGLSFTWWGKVSILAFAAQNNTERKPLT